MKATLILVVIIASAGCVSAVEHNALKDQNMALQRRLEALEKRQNVKHEKKETETGGMSAKTSMTNEPPTGGADGMMVAPMTVAAGDGDLVYDSHGRYKCYVDSAPQVELGPRVEITNPADSPYAKSLIVNGEEVVFLRANGGNTYAEEGVATNGAARNANGSPMLFPGESCVFRAGNAQRLILKSKAYVAVGGTVEAPVYDTKAWGKYPSGTSATNNLDKYQVDPIYTPITLLDRYYGRR